MRFGLFSLVVAALLLFTSPFHSTGALAEMPHSEDAASEEPQRFHTGSPDYADRWLDSAAAVPYWFQTGSMDHADRRLQVFHPERGKVIGVVDVTEEIHQQAELWLKSVNGRSPEVSIDAKCGYVFKIPLLREVALRHSAFQGTVSELFLFYCPDRPPRMLVFSIDNKPYLLTFTHSVEPFLRIMRAYQFMNQ